MAADIIGSVRHWIRPYGVQSLYMAICDGQKVQGIGGPMHDTSLTNRPIVVRHWRVLSQVRSDPEYGSGVALVGVQTKACVPAGHVKLILKRASDQLGRLSKRGHVAIVDSIRRMKRAS